MHGWVIKTPGEESQGGPCRGGLEPEGSWSLWLGTFQGLVLPLSLLRPQLPPLYQDLLEELEADKGPADVGS